MALYWLMYQEPLRNLLKLVGCTIEQLVFLLVDNGRLLGKCWEYSSNIKQTTSCIMTIHVDSGGEASHKLNRRIRRHLSNSGICLTAELGVLDGSRIWRHISEFWITFVISNHIRNSYFTSSRVILWRCSHCFNAVMRTLERNSMFHFKSVLIYVI